MIELILGTYGVLCWLLFKKWKIIPTTTNTVCTAILVGVLLCVGILLLLATFHPSSKDGRLYSYTTPIVAQVKGIVTQVTTEGKPLKQGDVLFQIDPEPYQIQVDRLEAMLAQTQVRAEQLTETLNAANADVEMARADLRTAESDYDRQAKEQLSKMQSAVEQAKTQLDFQSKEFGRSQELLAKKVIPQVEYDQTKGKYDLAVSELQQAETAARQADESIKSGESRIQSAREILRQVEAKAKSAQIAAEAESSGINPEVRQIEMELEAKRWDLEQTTVRAPSDGFVTHMILRPGQLVVPMPLSPVAIFVHGEKPVLGATYSQNIVTRIEPGLEAEVTLKAVPGRIFKAKVRQIIPVMPEGQLLTSGQMKSVSSVAAPGRISVVFDYEEDLESLNLPGGSHATIAIYTHHVHALSIVRKILIRIKCWENYIFLP